MSHPDFTPKIIAEHRRIEERVRILCQTLDCRLTIFSLLLADYELETNEVVPALESAVHQYLWVKLDEIVKSEEATNAVTTQRVVDVIENYMMTGDYFKVTIKHWLDARAEDEEVEANRQDHGNDAPLD